MVFKIFHADMKQPLSMCHGINATCVDEITKPHLTPVSDENIQGKALKITP